MSDFINPKARSIVMCIALVLMVLSLAACESNKSKSVSTASVGNDSAVKGTFKAFNPAHDVEIASGKAIEGSEEEKLQQERIAGGAVGAPVSHNLEPLGGITDYSKGGYVNMFGIDSQPPAVEHNYGTNCVTCHNIGDDTEKDLAVTQLPPQLPSGHAESNLKNKDCASCHKTRSEL